MNMEKVMLLLNAKLIAANKPHFLTDEYKQLHTDEERVKFTLKVMQEYDIVPKASGDTKNAQESIKLREQGNKIFLSKQLTGSACVEAIKLYTKSIAYAPYPSVELAVAYANRSAVLIKVHKYKECLRDIDRALSLEYPPGLRAKLYIRKVECLASLKDSTVEEAIKEATSWLDKINISDINKENFNKKLSAAKTLSQKSRKQNNNFKTKPNVPVVKSKNPEIHCASDAVAIRYNEKFGRHVVATRKIKPGEILAVEKPYSWMLAPANAYTHCSNCLEVCWDNIPCDYCVCAMYCSKKCKTTDWEKFHDVECPVFPILLNMDFVKLDLFSLRIAVQAVRESKSIQELRAELEEVDSCNGK